MENVASAFSEHELNATPIRAFILGSLMEQAIMDQKAFLKASNKVGMGSEEQQGLHSIFQRLKSGEQQIKVYEDEAQQRAARKVCIIYIMYIYSIGDDAYDEDGDDDDAGDDDNV